MLQISYDHLTGGLDVPVIHLGDRFEEELPNTFQLLTNCDNDLPLSYDAYGTLHGR